MDLVSRAKEIINLEAAAISAIPIDESFEKAAHLIVQCTGKIITTGMGKAGAIAKKMAGTLCSTGTPACYLHPGESEHGDLGLIAPGDIIIAYSTSGKTREILEMLRLAERLGTEAIIGITSHPDSAIRSLSTVVLNMGEVQEPCSLGLTPTASTIVMMALSDALALVLMEMRGFTRQQFGFRHHGGYLGQISNA